MFVLLESEADVNAARDVLRDTLRKHFNQDQTRAIGHAGRGVKNQPIWTDGNTWCAELADKNGRPMLWWGRLPNGQGQLRILVETNVARPQDNDCAGSFARDPETGQVVLMHSGRMSGRSARAFFSFLQETPVPVANKAGEIEHRMLVMPISGAQCIQPLMRFLHKVEAYKGANPAVIVAADNEWGDLGEYFPEPGGKRAAALITRRMYIARHGEVVDALHKGMEPYIVFAGRGLRLAKSPLVDLAVVGEKERRVVFEVKTGLGRQELYTAIGQLMVHSPQPGCQRVLVVPGGEDMGSITTDIEQTLRTLGIEVLRYHFDATGTVQFTRKLQEFVPQ